MSDTGSHTGSTPNTSTLNFDIVGGTDPQTVDEPFRSTLSKKFGKVVKAMFPKVKWARIRGNAHQSSSAPEQGKVLSIQLLDMAGKKVVETIHILSDGEWIPSSVYTKNKKAAAKKH